MAIIAAMDHTLNLARLADDTGALIGDMNEIITQEAQ